MDVFKVLWFEDNIGNFQSIIKSLESHALMSNRKFEYENLDHYPDDFDVKMFEGEYSIAFIDLNLNNGQKGTQIIKILNETGIFLDILLYSNNPIELEKLTEGPNHVEGVFRHATMDGIDEKMKNLIDQVHYKEIMVLKRFGY